MQLRLIRGLWLALLQIPVAFGQFATFSTPTPVYTGGTTLIPITAANFASVASVTNGAQTLSFSTNVDARTVPGGGWGSWASPPNTESATPRVVFAASVTTFTITLSTPQRTFGFELEPNTFGTFSLAVDFLNGSTSLGTITQSIASSSGARLMAASSTTPITSVVITAPAGAGGFAMAQFRYSAAPVAITGVPTLGPVAMSALAIMLGATGTLLARRQQRMI